VATLEATLEDRQVKGIPPGSRNQVILEAKVILGEGDSHWRGTLENTQVKAASQDNQVATLEDRQMKAALQHSQRGTLEDRQVKATLQDSQRGTLEGSHVRATLQDN
jgi:hypothetical protein